MNDPQDPTRFQDVLVDKRKLRELVRSAPKSSEPGVTLLNGLISLVFTESELGHASGLGLKGPNKGNSLDSKKVAAIKGEFGFFVLSFPTDCKI